MLITTILILVVTAAFFVAGKLRSDLVALCSLLALLIFQILTPEEALSGFSNSVVIMMVGLFVVGGAIFQTGLAKMISSKILNLAGTSELRLFLLVMLVTASIGAFVSNTGTVALMLPIVVSMAVNAGSSPRRLLMPLAFASSMGGMMTLIGTPPNLIIQDTLVHAGFPSLSFFSFLPVGLVCITVGILVLLPLTRWFLAPKKKEGAMHDSGKTLDQLVKEYGLSDNLFRLKAIADSEAIGKTVVDLDVHRKYGINILGIRRKKDYLLNDLGSVKLHSGDVLLVQGDWKDIARLEHEDTEWVVLGQPLKQAAEVTLDYKAPLAATIMILMVALMVFDWIPVAPVTAVMIAGVLMVLTGCFRSVEAAYKTINWETIVLFAAMLPMSHALEKTGASAWISDALVQSMGGSGPIVLLAGVYFTTSLMTMFISNTVTAVLMAPIALQSAISIGVSPVPYLFAVTVAASMCFASPFSTPPNALVMPAGQYTFMAYIKVGLPLQIIMGLVMIAVLPLLFPF